MDKKVIRGPRGLYLGTKAVRLCQHCQVKFKKTTNNQKYCLDCKKSVCNR